MHFCFRYEVVYISYMHKLLQFLSQKSVLLFGIALFVLASPTIYLAVGMLMMFIRGVARPEISYDTFSPFIQAMELVSFLGFVILAISRISAWILAFQKLKARRAKS